MSNIELRERWVKALRSGKYEQIQSNLRTKHGYCCLGVLCDVIMKETGSETTWELDEGGDRYKLFGIHYGGLPTTYQQMMGLITDEGEIELNFIKNEATAMRLKDYVAGRSGQVILTVLNDSGGWSFEDIADLIENEPQAIFLGEE